jgi:hypothetical protein
MVYESQLRNFLDKYKMKSGELSDTTSYAPMPWETMVRIFETINGFVSLDGKKILDIGAGDLRVSLYGAGMMNAKVMAVEKDPVISYHANSIIKDCISSGVVGKDIPISLLLETDILNVPLDYSIDATIFNYTEPKDKLPGIDFKEKFLEKTSWLRPGVLMAFLIVDAYLDIEKPITSYMDLVADRIVQEKIGGRTFILYRKFVSPKLGEYLRPAYQHIRKKMGEGRVGILIGAYNGVSAEYAYYGLNPSKYYLVDPYVKYADLDGTYSYKQEAWDLARESLISKFGDKENAFIIQKKSEDTYMDFQDEYFDFVYIDADHSYEHVKLDMELWWPKVKRGGVMAGHDFQLVGHVDKAVGEWSEKMNIPFSTKACPWNAIPDWWIDKPRRSNAAKQ